MAGKQAKTLSIDHIDDLLFFAEHSRHPLRNRLIVLLSVKAGLRAAEIAKLTWAMLLDPSGEVGSTLEVRDEIAKKRGGRSIPIHPELRKALVEARRLYKGDGPLIRSERGGAMTPMSIVVWFSRAYDELGFEGCSSHSGRRTFITRAARSVHKAGGSLRDVQLLAGHRSIQTTQRTSTAIVTLNGGWYPSSSNQSSGSTLGKDPDQQEIGRGEDLRSAEPR